MQVLATNETSDRLRTSDHSEDEFLTIEAFGVFGLETAGFRVRVARFSGRAVIAKSRGDDQADDGQTENTVYGDHDCTATFKIND